VNLVSNIGFGHQGATHTNADVYNQLSSISTFSLEFPLKHPTCIHHQKLADIRSMRNKLFPSMSLKVLRLFGFILKRIFGCFSPSIVSG
jgi:hypothetical protein